jgi:hypothetical protein
MTSATIARSPRASRAQAPSTRRRAMADTTAGPAGTWTVTASLCAARQEADGSIHLAVSDPTGRPHRLIVRIPSKAGGPADICLYLRAVAARRAFIREVVEPPFEGFAVLYGTARLTLTHSKSHRAIPHVLDFTLLDGAQPKSPCRHLPRG